MNTLLFLGFLLMGISGIIIGMFLQKGRLKKKQFGTLTGQDFLFDLGLLRVRQQENDLIISDPKVGDIGIGSMMEQFAIKKFAEHGMILSPRPKENKEMVHLDQPEAKTKGPIIEGELESKVEDYFLKNSRQ